jgi:hypothetical protein
VVAVLTHAAFVMPQFADVPCVGASGAISAVLGGFAVLLPGTYVQCVVLLFGSQPIGAVRLRAWFVLGFWFAMQLGIQWLLAGSGTASGVAYGAHIGGFLFGWALFGMAHTVRAARRDWRALTAGAALRRAAARINAGETLDVGEQEQPDAQRMAFLKHGTLPEQPDTLNDWVTCLDPATGDAAVAASVLLRMHLAESALDGRAEANGAEALASLGYPDLALACLLDRLHEADGGAAQEILCSLGLIVWRHRKDAALAGHCLQQAVELGPESPAAARAQRLQQLIREEG